MRPIRTRIAATIGTRSVGPIAIGLLVASAAVAHAQSAVTREITSEPVETTVTRGPDGSTAVTRRILTPAPSVLTYGPPPDAYAPLPAEALAPQYVEPAAPALVPRRAAVATTVTSAPTTVGVSSRAPARPRATRTVTTRTVTHTATRRPAPPPTTEGVAIAPPLSDQPLALSPVQRQVIYRTIVQYPAPVPAPPPPVANGYPLTTAYPVDNSYGPYAAGYPDYDYGYRAYGYQEDRVLDPYHTAYRWNGIPLVVGARIPAGVPLVTMPEPVLASVPVARPYSYAVLDNRVFLVDPATGIIVAAIAQ